MLGYCFQLVFSSKLCVFQYKYAKKLFTANNEHSSKSAVSQLKIIPQRRQPFSKMEAAENRRNVLKPLALVFLFVLQ